MTTIRLPANNWRPRPHQLKLWAALENGKRRVIEIAHRRWGKDEIALNWAAVSIFEKPATYWHMLPEYSQARKAIWNAINPHTGKRRIDEAFPLEIRENTNDHEMFIRFKNGATWQVVGSDSYNSLVGSPPYGLVISEWALADPAAWAYLAPILEENGGWALFITTSRGKNHAYGTYNMAKNNPLWFAEKQTVNDTGFPLERVEAARLEYRSIFGIEAGDALIEQEYYCSFDAAILGAVYGASMSRADKAGRICMVPWDAAHPVNTAWDLGYDDATAIWWWQKIGKELRIIDYYECNGMDIDHYCEQLYGKEIDIKLINTETKIVEKWQFGEDIEGLERRRSYKYGKNYVPHDAANKLLQAGGRSIVQQAHALGITMYVVSATSQQNGINAARKTIETSWFDENYCSKGIDALRSYHFDYDEENKIFKSIPKHDWSSHAADAFEIIGQVWKNEIKEKEPEKPRFLHEATAKELFWPEKTRIRPERI